MEAFYVCIIFLGIILVIAALFFIIMDKVNGKDFFKEFDRKKDEMFNLIQDSEEMVQELNKMSDYVVTVISEKNHEFFNKNASTLEIEEAPKELLEQAQEEQVLLGVQENSGQDRLSKGTILQNADVESQGVVYQNQDVRFANPGVVYQKEDVKFANSGVVYQKEDVKFPNQETVNQNQDVKFANQEAIKQNEGIDFEKQENVLNPEIVDNSSYDNSTEIEQTSDSTFINNNLGGDIANEAAESIDRSKLSLSGIRGQVLQMIKKGFTDDEISKRLRVGKGEINLIRGLSK